MKIKALKEYTDQYISIYEEDVREVTDEVLAAKLIEDGVLKEVTEEEEGGEETPSGGETPTEGGETPTEGGEEGGETPDPTPDPDPAPVG